MDLESDESQSQLKSLVSRNYISFVRYDKVSVFAWGGLIHAVVGIK